MTILVTVLIWVFATMGGDANPFETLSQFEPEPRSSLISQATA